MPMCLRSALSVIPPKECSYLTLQTANPPPKPSIPPAGEANLNGEVYIADGDYIKDIEVNDLRNRYTLTKSATQKQVNILVMLIPEAKIVHLWC